MITMKKQMETAETHKTNNLRIKRVVIHVMGTIESVREEKTLQMTMWLQNCRWQQRPRLRLNTVIR